ncbi:MAG: hypothetical protein PHP06_06010 [Clostridia bacterium]|nr:hypothetical protein [Clostridia bacterium]
MKNHNTTSYCCLSLLLVLVIFIPPVYAATTKSVDGGGASGDTVYWIILTVALTIIFAMRGVLASLLHNPIFIIGLTIIVILSYMFWKAIEITYGVGSAVDTQIENIANLMR